MNKSYYKTDLDADASAASALRIYHVVTGGRIGNLLVTRRQVFL